MRRVDCSKFVAKSSVCSQYSENVQASEAKLGAENAPPSSGCVHRVPSTCVIVTVFQAIIVSRILYALPVWGCFLSKELSGRIDAFLKRRYRYGFASESEHVDGLLD